LYAANNSKERYTFTTKKYIYKQVSKLSQFLYFKAFIWNVLLGIEYYSAFHTLVGRVPSRLPHSQTMDGHARHRSVKGGEKHSQVQTHIMKGTIYLQGQHHFWRTILLIRPATNIPKSLITKGRAKINDSLFSVSGIEHRASHLLGNCSTTWATHHTNPYPPLPNPHTQPVLLLLVCYSDRALCFCPGWPQIVIILALPPK
jgi:hypothetical protein